MTENLTNNLIKQLEDTLRSKSGQSNWFFLEPVNEDLLLDLKNTLDSRPEQDPIQVESSPQNSATGRSASFITQEKPSPVDSVPPIEACVPVPAPAPLNMEPMDSKTLDSMRLRLRDCTRCDLCNDRQKIVFGQGNINAELVFIGEGPGADEDKSGVAFVGKAGKLLTQMIQSIGVNREAVYICNAVKCRPPGNRNPNTNEIATCSPFLFKQLDILKPRLIVTMGNVATKTLLPHAYGIMKMRGKLTTFNGTPLIPTFHPSYLLRNPSALGRVWEDMRQIRQVLFQQKQEPAGEER
jgi:uracil-DNA glycosylase